MRDVLVYLLVLLLVLILQVSLFSRLPAASYGPDLILVLVFSIGFLFGPKKGGGFGFAAGLLQDVLLGAGLGNYTISRIIIGAFAGKVRGRIFPEKIFLITPVILGFALIQEIIIFLLSENVIFRIDFRNAFISQFLPSALYTTLVGMIIYVIIYFLFFGGGQDYEEED
ncbi:rod shape-determining protein MreD [Halarsenatibacter silvermanii]|uniref:Rod shape-determining protein MreD n=1 Tax=Halarsenatibacter silvermanii TaxID=321763 RepID=A0A1G9PAT4_9FIRM|nr:rod shape-determining protein MreD [Halarsenatibacter silvermanii]SDL95916.1 rod shape-determining protein MreD [Halarsenatibacter silvermanii]